MQYDFVRGRSAGTSTYGEVSSGAARERGEDQQVISIFGINDRIVKEKSSKKGHQNFRCKKLWPLGV